ncbi:caspase family protein [Bradyrhizobium sp.]|uniref:caspase family protein n=1 Tax=Bradyrhizobium sp. TaxID=376 RepID=UPI0025C12E1E|nr:caspase family protein [Bradyrhizobium sp.]
MAIHDAIIASCTAFLEKSGGSARDRAFAHEYRGISRKIKGQHEAAIADIGDAIKLCEPAAGCKIEALYNTRAHAWMAKGGFENALSDLAEALRINPNFANAHIMRGLVWWKLRRLDDALADYARAIELNPKSSLVYNNRGLIWLDKGEIDRAIADSDTAIRLEPKNGSLYNTRATAWRLKGDLVRALFDHDQAVRLTRNSLAYSNRAETFRYKGDFARSIADYEEALRMRSDFTPALTGLGLTYERMGDTATARSKFELAARSPHADRDYDGHTRALETAQARLAALDSGEPSPEISPAPAKAVNLTSIPTPAIAAPILKKAITPERAAATAAKQGRRVALVIGNSAYQEVTALANPRKDADAIAITLRNLGFEAVTLALDVTREQLMDALRSFANETATADWAMVYYAGHGIEMNGQNYLVPVDARLAADRAVELEAVALEQVLAALDGAKKLKLVLLDACRDSPFALQMRKATASGGGAGGSTAGTRSVGRGLGEVKVQGDSLVVLAAKHGRTVLDGEGANSPFAVALVQRIATPGVEINQIFRLVRDDVMEATAGRQEPSIYGSLPGKEDFFFVAAK